MSKASKAANRYAARFQDREQAIRKVSFEAGAKWREGNPHPPFPSELPEKIDTSWCSPTNPCPTRPKRRLRRFMNQPWRCPTCTRWWVIEHRSNYANYDTGGHYVWIRAEAE